MGRIIQTPSAGLKFSELLREISLVVDKFSMAEGQDQIVPCDFRRRLDRPEIRSSPSMAAPDYGKIAHQLYVERRCRDKALGLTGLLGEPVWDMLLDLTISHERQEKLTVSAVTVGSEVPATTALRYIDVMEKRGLIERTPDTQDKRRTWITLTEEGIKMMHKSLDAILEATPAAPNVTLLQACSA